MVIDIIYLFQSIKCKKLVLVVLGMVESKNAEKLTKLCVVPKSTSKAFFFQTAISDIKNANIFILKMLN